ncbi:Lrp/AsnC family transcriptional regulator [Streptomyces sp. NBC_01754]|uniref:Lrp/AsnC family transcriptional regulator n=1 Tax=Streptomyces sp. NBC_01754 TaxID=2975930 RepID=UPI002DDB344E|nr:AsnC family transcriptional regulator [Streptomyces sp. NBC_01754]WSC93788.1 Lrp/AsnC family transcriptional regulator [Streptomyces sp. NBC_01754]
MESVTLDELDRRLIHALQLDGRMSFSRIAAAIGAQERTVARRYNRLRSRLVLRVVGILDSRRIGMLEWIVRVRCAPEVADALAAQLAQRDDTSWIAPLAGGAELTCMIRTPPPGGEGQRPFFEQLARTQGVRDVSAACLLRPVAGVGGWAGRMGALSEAEQALLRAPEPEPEPESAGPLEATHPTIVWSAADNHLMRVLSKDARAGLGQLTAATGWSESTVRRRIGQLREAGVLAFEVEVDPALFGFGVEALMWLEVAPAGLRTVTTALSLHSQVAFAALTTGATAVFAIVECLDADALCDYLSTELARLPAVTRVETALTRSRTKRAGPLLMPAIGSRPGPNRPVAR